MQTIWLVDYESVFADVMKTIDIHSISVEGETGFILKSDL